MLKKKFIWELFTYREPQLTKINIRIKTKSLLQFFIANFMFLTNNSFVNFYYRQDQKSFFL